MSDTFPPSASTMSQTHEATLFFAGVPDRPYYLAEADVRNVSGHEALVRQLAQLAGASGDPDDMLSIRSHPPRADECPRNFKTSDLISYISAAVRFGSFGGRIGTTALLSACCGGPAPEPAKPTTVEPVNIKNKKDDDDGSNYCVMRPHLIVWTERMVGALASLPTSLLPSQENVKTPAGVPKDPRDLAGQWMLKCHAGLINGIEQKARPSSYPPYSTCRDLPTLKRMVLILSQQRSMSTVLQFKKEDSPTDEVTRTMQTVSNIGAAWRKQEAYKKKMNLW